MNFYDFNFETPSGKKINISDYKGSAVLIVNTATQCGLTPQFDGLESLHKKYKDKGLVVIGFPCNQFNNQEPETNESIVDTCRLNHGVTFQLSQKISVNGKDTHPLFKYLKKELGGIFGKRIKWNFTKFLIDPQGNPYKRYSPTKLPKDIEKDIIAILA